MTTALSVICLIAGILLIFLPDEIGPFLYSPAPLNVLLELAGAALFSFGILNWLSRYTTLGGIYGRPFVFANLAHFFIAGLPLAKAGLRDPAIGPLFWPFTTIYLAGAVLYGLLLFRNPLRSPASNESVG